MVNGREAQDRWAEVLVLMKWLSWQQQSLKYPQENSKQMLRLRNGNGLTRTRSSEQLEAYTGSWYDYHVKLLFSVMGFLSVVTSMVLLCRRVLGCLLAARGQISGETPSRVYLSPKGDWFMWCEFRFCWCALFCSPAVQCSHTSIAVKSQCKINPACKQVQQWELYSVSQISYWSCNCVRNCSTSL